ncbi:MAG: class I SAM-dependent methyltransferase [Pirellulaceae bacterium]
MIRKASAGSASTQTRYHGPELLLPETHLDLSRDEPVLDYAHAAAMRLLDRETSHQHVGRTVREIYGVLSERRKNGTVEQWQGFVNRFRESRLQGVLHEDPFTARAWTKPRGYAGDAVLLDFIYGSEHQWATPAMSWVGQRLHRWTTLSSACEGVKARRARIADMIDELADHRAQPHVLSLAAGHLREAEFTRALPRRQLGRLVAIDSDAESLEVIDRDYGRYGVEPVLASARDVVSGRFDFGSFDLIYSSGLLDYLGDSLVQKLTRNLFAMVRPGGRLVLTNFLEDIEGIGYMEAVMDWNLIYRDRLQLMEMTALIPQHQIGSINIFTEESCNVLFLILEKPYQHQA